VKPTEDAMLKMLITAVEHIFSNLENVMNCIIQYEQQKEDEEKRMIRPTVSRVVHYQSYGTPVEEDGKQVYPMACRAAVVTEVVPSNVEERCWVGLAVLNPEGLYFNRNIGYHDPEDGPVGGTWHWPEPAPFMEHKDEGFNPFTDGTVTGNEKPCEPIG